MGLRGSVLISLEELEAAASGLTSSRRRKNVERSKLFYRKFQGSFKPKVGEVSVGISFFKQSPHFTANNLIPMMNP
jgi:hypothetical protein